MEVTYTVRVTQYIGDEPRTKREAIAFVKENPLGDGWNGEITDSKVIDTTSIKVIDPDAIDRKATAKRLLKDGAYKGNNGFTGDALNLWTTMRDDFVAAVRSVARTGTLTAEQSERVGNAECPRERHNTDGSFGGTNDGEGWVESVRRLVEDTPVRG